MALDNSETQPDHPYTAKDLETLDWCMGLDTLKEQKQAKRYGLVFSKK